ncbi:hypothetical protein CJF43_17195 [Pseudomonas fragi]|uniref:Uncharacterized protein n=1 Tax=Pseudomonas fragi TaxID=296 RepID=A0A266LT24_PSEFR|nr:hypothetical protein [Pseudomonas fragi]OZY40572.1 hypothetical protein CJF43_17195 [Pseudomonas fragi]
MNKVKDVKSGAQSVFQEDGKWKDTVGGSHNSRAQAEFALLKEIQEREHEGTNTLTKIDGVFLLIWLVTQILLYVIAYGAFKDSSFLGGLLFGSIGLALSFAGYKFFFSTMPSFREKMYFVIIGILIAGYFIQRNFNLI